MLGQSTWLGGLAITIAAARVALRAGRDPGAAWTAVVLAACAAVLAFFP